jgi:DNA-binding NtrC family response regulator
MAKVKVLVVDDDQIVLDSCGRILEAEEFTVYLAQDADRALKVMHRVDCSLVLLDVKMPGCDGLHLMQKIKEQWPTLPIILMTGYPTMETIVEGFQIGALTYIAKPFTPEELLSIVHQVIGEEQCSVYKCLEL